MIEIQNKSGFRIPAINLKGGKNITLLAKGKAYVTDEELSSPHLQALLAKGYIRIVTKNIEEDQKQIKTIQKKPAEVIEKKKASPETQPSKSKPQKEDVKSET